MSRLLVLACSARKRKGAGLVPAIDRYDGPAFQVLRKHLREAGAQSLGVVILSAKYGIIAPDHEIPDYDLRMTADAADAMRSVVLRVLRQVVNRTTYLEIAFCLGRDYLRAVSGYGDVVPGRTAITFIRGGLGTRLRNLREWLRADHPKQTRLPDLGEEGLCPEHTSTRRGADLVPTRRRSRPSCNASHTSC